MGSITSSVLGILDISATAWIREFKIVIYGIGGVMEGKFKVKVHPGGWRKIFYRVGTGTREGVGDVYPVMRQINHSEGPVETIWYRKLWYAKVTDDPPADGSDYHTFGTSEEAIEFVKEMVLETKKYEKLDAEEWKLKILSEVGL